MMPIALYEETSPPNWNGITSTYFLEATMYYLKDTYNTLEELMSDFLSMPHIRENKIPRIKKRLTRYWNMHIEKHGNVPFLVRRDLKHRRGHGALKWKRVQHERQEVKNRREALKEAKNDIP
jgi:hypothetical protein